MDHNATYIRRSHYMTNIAVQVSGFNQGIWVEAENMVECCRDIKPLKVYGGVVFGDTSNDYFLSSHGTRTPELIARQHYTASPQPPVQPGLPRLGLAHPGSRRFSSDESKRPAIAPYPDCKLAASLLIKSSGWPAAEPIGRRDSAPGVTTMTVMTSSRR